MKNIPTAPPLPDAPPAQDFSKLGFVYITVLGLANQVVPYTGSWRPLATALNYLVRIAPIVYMAFQAQPASPVGVQLDSSMGHDSWIKNKVKKCLPQNTKDLFNILEVSQFEMPPDVMAAFYKHSESFLPKALASELIR
ncbi:hypothetical protein DSO57_1014827 [Entomophthora muscae]|uniref:Uncharacterized protein n=1 Tax=Entomophthora muscae TaxID=34485 RepID=A0ACC2RJY4_9FUNG|nr:hypothetical protein DSO57_1014827 [Entomophthora muscae]